MQILVVVANIQTGTLKTEVEKGSTGTALERGSVGPQRRDNSRLSGRARAAKVVAIPRLGGGRAAALSSPARLRKGIGLTFPNPDAENGPGPRVGAVR